MPKNPDVFVKKMLTDLENLVQAEREETVRRLHDDLDETIRRVGEEFNQKWSSIKSQVKGKTPP